MKTSIITLFALGLIAMTNALKVRDYIKQSDAGAVDTVEKRFSDFIAKNKRSYGNQQEYIKRLGIFR
jgi:hypothetical protein